MEDVASVPSARRVRDCPWPLPRTPAPSTRFGPRHQECFQNIATHHSEQQSMGVLPPDGSVPVLLPLWPIPSPVPSPSPPRPCPQGTSAPHATVAAHTHISGRAAPTWGDAAARAKGPPGHRAVGQTVTVMRGRGSAIRMAGRTGPGALPGRLGGVLWSRDVSNSAFLPAAVA